MILPLLLALAAQQGAPPPPGVPVRQGEPGAEPIPLMIAEPVAMAIAAFDRDGDGRVTRAEFTAGVAQSFAAIARGQAMLGYVAFGDWAERWLGNRNALPSPFEVDQDGDNRITLPELQARFELFFDRFDRDRNGSITRGELLTVRQTPRPGERPGQPQDKRKPRDR